MILSRRLGFAIVLIPRSGTTAITAACEKVLRPGEILRIKHLTAASMAGHLQGLRVISIHRNPWARIYSEWWVYRRNVEAEPEFEPWAHAFVERWAKSEFENFVVEKYLSTRRLGWYSSRGFWPYYCHAPGSIELVTDPWPFEDLATRWAAFADSQGLPPLEVRNVASKGDYRDAYSPALRDEIGAWAAWEIERFGYDFSRGESNGALLSRGGEHGGLVRARSAQSDSIDQ